MRERDFHTAVVDGVVVGICRIITSHGCRITGGGGKDIISVCVECIELYTESALPEDSVKSEIDRTLALPSKQRIGHCDSLVALDRSTAENCGILRACKPETAQEREGTDVIHTYFSE